MVYSESRDNGTPLQTNATTIRSLTAGLDWSSVEAGSFTVRAYGGDEGYDQSFSAINADRTEEALTRTQRVPIQQLGVSTTWVRALSEWGTAIAGLDPAADCVPMPGPGLLPDRAQAKQDPLIGIDEERADGFEHARARGRYSARSQRSRPA